MRPPPALLEQLKASRLLPMRARPSVGIGERRSRSKGAGMEFIDHRPYRAGGDTRHLDPHVMARTGEAVIRQYVQGRQLPVTLVIDASPSMLIEDGAKFRSACLLAQVLGFVALTGGDRVQAAMRGARGLALSPRWQGAARAEALFAWIAGVEAGAADAGFAATLADVTPHLPQAGLVVALSDWWGDGVRQRLDILHAAGHEILAMQILSPGESDPARLGQGLMTLLDAETGAEVEVMSDAETLGRYGVLLRAWQTGLRELFSARHWHFLAAPSDAGVYDICLRTLRGVGVLA
ncbi:DUF58 domain-containing protein [Paracoccaceae bacterium Fryx2]|nr:DUF58 domain-containing protein [Paracoccaceae bacterium Fryx2]